MANVNSPYGARILASEGKEYRVRRYVKKTGAAIFEGDFVTYDAAGNVTVAAAGSVLVGVAMQSLPSASTADIAVMDDPDALLEIQASGSVVAADVFLNADIVATAGDSTINRSKHALDHTSIATTATLQLKILGLSAIDDNAYGSFARLKVKMNAHFQKAGVAGV